MTAIQSQGRVVVEIEPVDLAGSGSGSTDAMRDLNFLLTGIQNCTEQRDLLERTVDMIRHLTGYDRVMVYRFDPEFNGEVIAEAHRSSLETFVGLHFPHWDIPPQVRAIMQTVPLRLIPDVQQASVDLLADADEAPLDITPAACRAVSPIHLQYLRNMGSAGTLTLSVVVDGRLWGIISCHHGRPKLPQLYLREVLSIFLPNCAAKLVFMRQAETLRRIDGIDDRLSIQRSDDVKIGQFFPILAKVVLDIADADGIAILGGTEPAMYGHVPSVAMLDRLLADALAQDQSVIPIQSLTKAYPELETNGCAGVLIAPTHPNRAICLFRREVETTVAWAGNPEKTITRVSGLLRLQPRGSFATYLETVRGQCLAWTDDDIFFIRHIRTLLLTAERQSLSSTLSWQQSLMIDELNHRVRNILAVVRSVSQQARRRYAGTDDYAGAVEDRIQALASAHELTVKGLTTNASLQSLVANEVQPFGGEPDGRLIFQGPERMIRPDLAPLFSLVLHELAANAAKHGVLSTREGRVIFSLTAKDETVQIKWHEQGGPPVVTPREASFGTMMVEQAIPHELGGTAELEFRPDGVCVTLDLPERVFVEPTNHNQIPFPLRCETSASEKVVGPAEIDGTVMMVEDHFVIAREMRDQLLEFSFPRSRFYPTSNMRWIA